MEREATAPPPNFNAWRRATGAWSSKHSYCRKTPSRNNICRPYWQYGRHYYASATNRQGRKRCFCLMSVAYIGPNSRTDAYEYQNWHREPTSHDSDAMHFQGQKVKGQGHQAALLIAALTRPAAAAVSVGTYWA